jgi:hypothetical protein
MTPEQYLTKYYNFYTKGKFEESYKMLPAYKKESQTLEDYKQAHSSMPTESFTIEAKQQKGADVVIPVKLKLKKYGTWTISWHFVKDKKGYMVEDYSASGK